MTLSFPVPLRKTHTFQNVLLAGGMYAVLDSAKARYIDVYCKNFNSKFNPHALGVVIVR